MCLCLCLCVFTYIDMFADTIFPCMHMLSDTQVKRYMALTMSLVT